MGICMPGLGRRAHDSCAYEVARLNFDVATFIARIIIIIIIVIIIIIFATTAWSRTLSSTMDGHGATLAASQGPLLRKFLGWHNWLAYGP